MFLFFDTETSGLPRNYNAPLEQLDNWPRLVQIAWLLVDEKGSEVAAESRIIKPDGFFIPEAATRVHGISTERAMREGENLGDVLGKFAGVMDGVKVLVAHNMSFDERIVGAEYLRAGINHRMSDLIKICTMIESTDYCELPGRRGYKWPTLMELHLKLFNRGFGGAHDALVDVRATARCFFALLDRGAIIA